VKGALLVKEKEKLILGGLTQPTAQRLCYAAAEDGGRRTRTQWG
jgi:hypothetical protein